MLSILRSFAAVRYLLLARLVSSFGNWFSYMLLVVLTYQHTGKAADAMGVLAAQAAATLFFSFLSGPLVDRRHPAWIMAAADVARCVLVGALFFVPVSPGVYMAAAFLTAGAAAYFNPAEEKWVMLALPKEAYGEGAALRQLVQETTRVVGPSIAVGAIAAFGPGHAARGFLVDALSFLASAALIALAARGQRLSFPQAAARRLAAPWKDWREAWPTLSIPVVRILILVVVAVLVGLGGIDVVLLAYVRTDLRLSMLSLGYLITAISVGVIAGTLLTRLLTRGLPPWAWLGFGLGGLGAFFALTPIAPLLGWGIACMAATGFCNGIFNVNVSGYMQTVVPAPVAGRVFSLVGTLMSIATVLGMGLNSLLISRLGPGATMAAVGAWIALAGLAGGALLWRGRRLPSALSADGEALA